MLNSHGEVAFALKHGNGTCNQKKSITKDSYLTNCPSDMERFNIIGITPFEKPDTGLALSLAKANVFPVLHAGRDCEKANAALLELSQKWDQNFGVCFSGEPSVSLPSNVSLVIVPYGTAVKAGKQVTILYQVYSVEEALKARKEKAAGIIIKGNEAAGRVSGESSFILLQRILKEVPGIPVWVQGGIGVHTAAAVMAMGAKGIVLDSQLVLFPECQAPAEIKQVCDKLNGNETRVIDGFRVLVRPHSPALPEQATRAQLEAYPDTFELDRTFLPLGQDIAISADLVKRYRKLPRLAFALREAMHGHLKQAKAWNVLGAGNALARDLRITYPIAQGPMTRVSDVPAFANAVAEAGGLPFVALSLLKGEKAKALISETQQLAGDKTWGVGILGFAAPELREEQIEYIKEAKPPVVLIAGGRPSQAKPLEKMGIKTFLHVPSASLLDMFIKEGARRFVFEGRECGGHVGPLSSLVLWEKQIDRLLQEEHGEQFQLLFAGGIHDAASAAFIAVMAAPLAAKGMQVGVLMGTAYIYTQEAVSTGAILPQFQQQAVQQRETVLLETAPGHETRCLQSPFTGFFNEEKQRLLLAGKDKKEIWEQLEKLNVGRLRIAAKGIERRGDALVTIDQAEQFGAGMYMIGQVAALKNKVSTILDLHKEVAEGHIQLVEQAVLPALPEQTSKALDVAIVGMACIYPGARNIEEYWRNILLGKDCITEVPDERWNKELYYDAADTNGSKSPSKWGGFIPRIDFDPLEFGIPPQSLAAIDPTQLLSLLVAKQALENAGYAAADVNKENVSVIIGAEGGNDLANNYAFRSLFRQVFGEIPAEVDEALPKLTEDSFPGVLANVISGRITNRLDLGGRNYTVDAACASSLAAIDLACQELVLEKSDMVLAGAADLHNGINDYLMFASTHALSRKGKCLTFDAGADGIALGEGVAMLVLKRYDDAKRDGDKIYAVIKGVGGSSDGKSLGLTAPRKNGQMKALERAYEQAGISPQQVGLVEAHGTGTVVGDKTELSALSDTLLQAGAVTAQTHLGSVKTQIGHTKCAAGLAGLIKAALSVYHGVKPPTINLTQPNGYYNAGSSPFAFNTEAGIWTDSHRLAGVSAFGFGGTNFHAVLSNEAGVQDESPVMKAWPAELFVFRGQHYEAAKALLGRVRTLVDQNDALSLKDIAYSLAVYSQEPVQLSIVAESAEDLLLKIDLVLSGAEAKGIYTTRKQEGKVAFLFPGQGSQRINMARDLFVNFPVMRRLLKGNKQYEKVLFPDAVFDEASLKQQRETIKDTRLAQPLLGMVNLAIAGLLKQLGITPDMVAGHSYGELPALCFAGAFDETELVPLSEKRAKAILDAIEEDKGVMVAVHCAQDTLQGILAAEKEVYAVNHNSPQQWVLAGTTAVMERLMEKLKTMKISFKQLEVACAFHSPLLSRSKELYAAAIRDTPFRQPGLPVWSNTNAGLYPAAPDAIKERLAEHLVQPVRFAEQVLQMYESGARVFIEVGPGKVLTGLAKSILGKDELLLHTEEKDQNGLVQLLNTLGRYLASGRVLQLETLFSGRNARLLNLDEPAQHKRSATTWFVNGQMAVPATGKLPAYAGKPLTQPIPLKSETVKTVVVNNNPVSNGAEQMIQEYLNNIKFLVQAQRDVILGYLGHMPPSQPPAYTNGHSNGNGHSFPEPKPVPEVVHVYQPVPVHNKAAVVHTNGTNGHHHANGHVNGTNGQTAKPAMVKDLKAVLMKVVSDKTGYPQEMLGMEMDLEADLSIDSIKRMEIIGELRTQLGGFSSAGKPEETLVEQLAAIKTLSGLVSWMNDNTHSAATAEPVTAYATAVTTAAVPAQPGKSWSEQDIRSVILAAVSEKTGYPQDMLGMDLDLEADLSIDSIKRMEIIGELKTKLGGLGKQGAGEELGEQLASIKTLNGLVHWITEHATQQQAITEIQAPVTAVPATVPVAATSAAPDIKNILLAAVSEKTGYPQDMLGLDLDLEADLSIDSIKRMEIIGELKVKLGGLGEANGKTDELTEQLASIKTLNGLISWLTESVSGRLEPVQEAKQIIEEGFIKSAQSGLVRHRFELMPSRLSNSNAALLQEQKLAVTDDGGEMARAIQQLLQQQGAAADIVSPGDALDQYNGLIILEMFSSPKRPSITEAFSLIKQLDSAKVKWVYVLSDFKTHLDRQADVQLLRAFQGYNGFIKSLDKEWDHAKCRTINFMSELPPAAMAAITLDELLHTDEPAEVFYNGTQRHIYEQVAAQLAAAGQVPNIRLDKESVVLVLGGAQGITAELTTRFAKEYPCHYILVGRSADPRSNTQHELASLETKEAIRQYLIAKGDIQKPAEIEKKTQEIHKHNQILRSIRAMEASGATVSYHSLDLRDEAALGVFLDGLYKRFGKIDGVIHGAGILEDKLFQHKTADSFERVFSTKVTPLRVLAERLKADTQFVVLFSSVASVWGNRGQTDYAAANSVMDRYAWELRKKLQGKVVAINWGPWKGTGMVSPSLEKEYERRGIALIPLQAGMETFVNELKYGTDSQVLIMAE
jgi:acyl transferase domain-containing protein/NAD(P)H-dependent flavin oxidoreductase YrpB (nitropropane dioxygenase family)/NAD(P)-dependent dehydrogenase (short-subunit alcohol dehydrogenase family)/acyl carrier protein